MTWSPYIHKARMGRIRALYNLRTKNECGAMQQATMPEFMFSEIAHVKVATI